MQWEHAHADTEAKQAAQTHAKLISAKWMQLQQQGVNSGANKPYKTN